MQATTIDEVIEQLQQIIDHCRKNNLRAGYFAALYYKVTCRVKDNIANGVYEDGGRMEMLDVLFANRYLHAWQSYITGNGPTLPWQVAFDHSRHNSVLLLQHLMLGINAHINLDLGIAAIETTRNGNYTLESLRKDFNGINLLLSSLLYEVVNDINRISPMLSLLGFHANNSNSMLMNFTIQAARDGAWCFAEELQTDATLLDARINEIGKLGESLVKQQGFFINLTTKFVRLFEWSSPRKIIDVFTNATPKKKFKEIVK